MDQQSEPDPIPRGKKIPRAKLVNDGFVVFEVDGFAQLTPEQKLWPVISMHPSRPKPKLEVPPKE